MMISWFCLLEHTAKERACSYRSLCNFSRARRPQNLVRIHRTHIMHKDMNNVVNVDSDIRWKLFSQMSCHPLPHGSKADESKRVCLNICHACSRIQFLAGPSLYILPNNLSPGLLSFKYVQLSTLEYRHKSRRSPSWSFPAAPYSLNAILIYFK